MVQTVNEFKASINEVSARFVKVDKRKRMLDNLRKARLTPHKLSTEKWLACCEPGVPCTSRIMAVMEDHNADRFKKLVVACSEVKFCLCHVEHGLNSF